ncbi:MAG TPA: DUF1877 family protein [Candidatus Methylacidiphilales bacterium]|nr:DUF1877 family protein [Candidatus Methylacidiphilales bacterium]
MSVICEIIRLKDETIDELIATPKKVLHFYSPDYTPQPKPINIIGRWLGKKSEALSFCSARRQPGDKIDLDKAWDGLDFLLSSGRKDSGPCRLLAGEGIEIEEEIGYGNPQAFH